MYRPKPGEALNGNIYRAQATSRQRGTRAQATIGQGGTRVQATTGQGGTVRRVSVMSSDDEKRMAMRQEMLAARRAQQMPPQKIKLVYNRNQKRNADNKGSEKLSN